MNLPKPILALLGAAMLAINTELAALKEEVRKRDDVIAELYAILGRAKYFAMEQQWFELAAEIKEVLKRYNHLTHLPPKQP